MATSYTTILKLALPAQGELSGTWGDTVNNNITSMIEEAIAGRKVINTWSTNSATLSSADGTTSESRAAMLEFTDTGSSLSGAATVICPAQSKIYICKNAAGQTVTIKTSGGTGVAIPNGETMFVFCDGTNVEQAVTNISSLNVDGYALSIGGAITTAGAFTTSGANSLTLTTTGSTNVTLPTTGTLATTAGTETLTNKTLNSPAVGTAITLNARGEVRFGDADTSNYVGFEAPATVSSNQIWVLPAADGSADQVLKTDGSGNLSFVNQSSGGIASVSADSSPQLGGDLDTNGNSITTTSNANVKLAPNGTGYTELRGNTNAGAIRFNCESNSHGVTVKGPPHSANATYSLELPNADGTSGQVLQTDGSGKLSFTTVSSGSSFAGADYFKINPAAASAASASGTDAISSGRGASNQGDYSVAYGSASFVTSAADYGLAIGWNANTSAVGGQAIGTQAAVGTSENYSTALGYQAQATAANQLVLGSTNSSYGFSSILVGNSSYTPTQSMDLTTKSYVDSAVAGGGGGGGGGSQVHYAVLVETEGSGDDPTEALIIDFDKQTFNPRTWATNQGANFQNKRGWTGQNYTLSNAEGTFELDAPVYAGAPDISNAIYYCFTARQKTGSNVTLTSTGNGRIELDLEIVNIGSSGFIYLQPEVKVGNSQVATFSQTLSTSGSTGTITFTKAGFQNSASFTTTTGLTLGMGHWDGGSHNNYLDVDYRWKQMRVYWGSGTTHTFDEPTRTLYTSPTTAQWNAAKWVGTYYGASASTNVDDYNWKRK